MHPSIRHTFTVCIALLFIASTSHATAPASSDLAVRIDAHVAPHFKADEPGATIIVVKDGKTVLRKAYGLANMDSATALAPDTVLRLGSITKQFTACAILLLAEQGKLSTGDDIRQYLPGFPHKGKVVTIEHLLTHTSGIPSYTSDPAYLRSMADDVTVAQMISRFKDAPLEFEPGTRFSYSNSGYFLLGAIIEKVSGSTYADFLAQHLFEPLGMRHTAHEGAERVKTAHARGYRFESGKFNLAPALSMTQPYAAGALVSTVDDLARWDAAISAVKLLTPASWNKAFTPYKLASGEAIDYGYGWFVGKLKGSHSIGHSGGINGFTTSEIRLPAEKVYVAVLSNVEMSHRAGTVMFKAAALAIGKPFIDHKPVKLGAAELDAFVGTYRSGTGSDIVVREGDHIMLQPAGRMRIALTPFSSTGFMMADSLTTYEFSKDDQGRVTALTVKEPGRDVVMPRTSAEPPARRVVVKLAPGVFERYIGRYELAPGFVLELRKEGERYIAQATGQAPFDIFPESDVHFFTTVVDAQLRFQDGSAPVTGLTLVQGGREMPAKRLSN